MLVQHSHPTSLCKRLCVKDLCAFVCPFLLHNCANIPSIHLQAQKPNGPKQSYCHQLWLQIPSCKALPHFSAATGTGGGPGTAFYQALDSTRINCEVTDSKWSHRVCVRWTETGCKLSVYFPTGLSRFLLVIGSLNAKSMNYCMLTSHVSKSLI